MATSVRLPGMSVSCKLLIGKDGSIEMQADGQGTEQLKHSLFAHKKPDGTLGLFLMPKEGDSKGKMFAVIPTPPENMEYVGWEMTDDDGHNYLTPIFKSQKNATPKEKNDIQAIDLTQESEASKTSSSTESKAKEPIASQTPEIRSKSVKAAADVTINLCDDDGDVVIIDSENSTEHERKEKSTSNPTPIFDKQKDKSSSNPTPVDDRKDKISSNPTLPFDEQKDISSSNTTPADEQRDRSSSNHTPPFDEKKDTSSSNPTPADEQKDTSSSNPTTTDGQKDTSSSNSTPADGDKDARPMFLFSNYAAANLARRSVTEVDAEKHLYKISLKSSLKPTMIQKPFSCDVPDTVNPYRKDSPPSNTMTPVTSDNSNRAHIRPILKPLLYPCITSKITEPQPAPLSIGVASPQWKEQANSNVPKVAVLQRVQGCTQSNPGSTGTHTTKLLSMTIGNQPVAKPVSSPSVTYVFPTNNYHYLTEERQQGIKEQMVPVCTVTSVPKLVTVSTPTAINVTSGTFGVKEPGQYLIFQRDQALKPQITSLRKFDISEEKKNSGVTENVYTTAKKDLSVTEKTNISKITANQNTFQKLVSPPPSSSAAVAAAATTTTSHYTQPFTVTRIHPVKQSTHLPTQSSIHTLQSLRSKVILDRDCPSAPVKHNSRLDIPDNFPVPSGQRNVLTLQSRLPSTAVPMNNDVGSTSKSPAMSSVSSTVGNELNLQIGAVFSLAPSTDIPDINRKRCSMNDRHLFDKHRPWLTGRARMPLHEVEFWNMTRRLNIPKAATSDRKLRRRCGVVLHRLSAADLHEDKCDKKCREKNLKIQESKLSKVHNLKRMRKMLYSKLRLRLFQRPCKSGVASNLRSSVLKRRQSSFPTFHKSNLPEKEGMSSLTSQKPVKVSVEASFITSKASPICNTQSLTSLPKANRSAKSLESSQAHTSSVVQGKNTPSSSSSSLVPAHSLQVNTQTKVVASNTSSQNHVSNGQVRPSLQPLSKPQQTLQSQRFFMLTLDGKQVLIPSTNLADPAPKAYVLNRPPLSQQSSQSYAPYIPQPQITSIAKPSRPPVSSDMNIASVQSLPLPVLSQQSFAQQAPSFPGQTQPLIIGPTLCPTGASVLRPTVSYNNQTNNTPHRGNISMPQQVLVPVESYLGPSSASLLEKTPTPPPQQGRQIIVPLQSIQQSLAVLSMPSVNFMNTTPAFSVTRGPSQLTTVQTSTKKPHSKLNEASTVIRVLGPVSQPSHGPRVSTPSNVRMHLASRSQPIGTVNLSSTPRLPIMTSASSRQSTLDSVPSRNQTKQTTITTYVSTGSNRSSRLSTETNNNPLGNEQQTSMSLSKSSNDSTSKISHPLIKEPISSIGKSKACKGTKYYFVPGGVIIKTEPKDKTDLEKASGDKRHLKRTNPDANERDHPEGKYPKLMQDILQSDNKIKKVQEMLDERRKKLEEIRKRNT